MKYLNTYKLFESVDLNQWIITKKDDIIDCCHELTDLSYIKNHCGHLGSTEDETFHLEEYIKFENHFNRFEILLDGEIIGEELRSFCEGVFKDGEITLKTNHSGDELQAEILVALDDALGKLSSQVFNDREYNISFAVNNYEVERGTCIVIVIYFRFV